VNTPQPILRQSIEQYRDDRVAIQDGVTPFSPDDIPQTVYHFSKPGNAATAVQTFRPAKPTSLLYRKTLNGYDLVGACIRLHARRVKMSCMPECR
jgi:hypothetical protein